MEESEQGSGRAVDVGRNAETNFRDGRLQRSFLATSVVSGRLDRGRKSVRDSGLECSECASSIVKDVVVKSRKPMPRLSPPETAKKKEKKSTTSFPLHPGPESA